MNLIRKAERRILLAAAAVVAGLLFSPACRLLPADEPDIPWVSNVVQPAEEEPILDLPLEALIDVPVLLNQPVTTVARQPSTVGRSPAAVYVIDETMIRRSGARSIPELLRTVPGLHVARIDANKWSVSSRGYSSRFSNKLLVQIDGRSVYTQLFAGTFWEVQDLLLDDVERIEVIRGPGATVWGANAVNGVINIITKSARDTHGTFAEAGGGSEEHGFVGGRVGNVTEGGVNWRVSGKWFNRDAQFHPGGIEMDQWHQGRVSFRADWDTNETDAWTVQGDYYRGTNGFAALHPFAGFFAQKEPVAGGNALARWTRTVDDDTDMQFQVYYDRTDRRTFNFDQNQNTFDVDFQSRFPVGECHNVIWGLGYRRVWDNLPVRGAPAPIAAFPVKRTTDLASAFFQDEMTLREDELYFTLGSKLEHNGFTGFEVQPSARLLWLPDERSAAWAAVSRAVRVPSRLEDDGRLQLGELIPGSGIPITFNGNPSVRAEELIAYEIGYRRQPSDWFSWDLAVFYNVYQDQLNIFPVPTFPFPPNLTLANAQRARSYGVELYSQMEMTSWWRLSWWYTFFKLDVRALPGAVITLAVTEGADPRHQAFAMSSWDLTCNADLDLIARYVDSLNSLAVPSYFTLDLRLAWQPNDNTEVAVVGQNLLDSHHPEYSTSSFTGEIPTEIQRSVYGIVTWRF